MGAVKGGGCEGGGVKNRGLWRSGWAVREDGGVKRWMSGVEKRRKKEDKK